MADMNQDSQSTHFHQHLPEKHYYLFGNNEHFTTVTKYNHCEKYPEFLIKYVYCLFFLTPHKTYITIKLDVEDNNLKYYNILEKLLKRTTVYQIAFTP